MEKLEKELWRKYSGSKAKDDRDNLINFYLDYHVGQIIEDIHINHLPAQDMGDIIGIATCRLVHFVEKFDISQGHDFMDGFCKNLLIDIEDDIEWAENVDNNPLRGCVHIHIKNSKVKSVFCHLGKIIENGIIHLSVDNIHSVETFKDSHPDDFDEIGSTNCGVVYFDK